MLKFIKNLFSRKKPENSQPIGTIENAIRKSSWASKEVTEKSTKKSTRETQGYRPYKSEAKSNNSYREDNSDFLTSMMIANATDSTLMGTLIGGDPVGAMIGDMMNDSDSHSSHSSYHEDSLSNDSYSSDSYSSDSFSSDSSSSDF